KLALPPVDQKKPVVCMCSNDRRHLRPYIQTNDFEKSTDNNGSANVIKIAGPKEIPTKRQKTDSSPATFAATHQSPRPKTSPASAKKTGSNFNRPVNRSQSSAPSINRNQGRRSPKRHQQTHDSRRITPSFRPTYQGLINASPSSIEGAGVNRNLQQQQQAANAFIQQARMITLMSQQQPQQQQRSQSLMGQGQQQQQQQQPWQSIMGGPPPQQSYGGICRNCGTQFLQGQPYCNNCRSPLH
ncbi:hypothetical protein ACTXT7_002267, partial [Hymenolepis weldensis]